MAFKKVSPTPKTVNLGSGKLMMGGKPMGEVSDLKLTITDEPPSVYAVKIGEHQFKVHSKMLADLLNYTAHVVSGDDNPSMFELKTLQGLIADVDSFLTDMHSPSVPYGPLPEVPPLDVKPKSVEMETGDESLDMLLAAAMDIASGLTTDYSEFHSLLGSYQSAHGYSPDEKVPKTAAEIIKKMQEVGLPVDAPLKNINDDAKIHQFNTPEVTILEMQFNDDETETTGVLWRGPSGATYHRQYKIFRKNYGKWVPSTKQAFLVKAVTLEKLGIPLQSGICVVDTLVSVPVHLTPKLLDSEQTKYPKDLETAGNY